MNVNSLSNISDLSIQKLISSAVTSARSASSSAISQDSNQVSPFAQVLNTLQQLQQQNPAEYQQVTQQISKNLQAAAQTATAEGNTTQANQLNQLATDFQKASTSNQLPNVQDLAHAIGGHHRHRHHASSSDSDSNSATSQLLSAFTANSASDDSLNPLSIISNTLSDAGFGASSN